ncbi:hypothetical protein DR950_36105 [Kitasatospora xanthocidica]|uniref:Phage tail assembly protein n=1 Tax=Kitasatospora xanthocidica TaxID=83382 RepID=A0A373A4E5_9ACTN|nr:hypothetical protein [Kitasatospora xanthocidica]RGD62460.1 hypothetical protein DR950_36105 [Kitasatospora xanthocidica]
MTVTTKARAAKAVAATGKRPSIAQDEALEQETHFDFRGTEYTIPAPLDMPVEVMELAGSDDTVGMLKAILGEDQWSGFLSDKPKMRDLLEFAEVLSEAAGFGEPGN